MPAGGAQRRFREAVGRTLLAIALPVLLTGCGVAGADATTAHRGGTSAPTRPSAATARSATPSPSPAATVPARGTGRFQYASDSGPTIGDAGTLLRYRVGVERARGADDGVGSTATGATERPVVAVDEVADFVDETLAAPQGWASGGRWRFQRSGTGRYDFTVYVATPRTTDRLCAPLRTEGAVSCRQGSRVVLNLARWLKGVPHYDADLATYRRYMINHEIGHRLGHGHEVCPGRGEPAPVMQQQTLKLAGCRGNPWPHVAGEAYHGPPGGYDG